MAIVATIDDVNPGPSAQVTRGINCVNELHCGKPNMNYEAGQGSKVGTWHRFFWSRLLGVF